MPADIVVITITDYVTVHPSAPAVTVFSSLQQPSTIAYSYTHSDTHSAMLSAISSSKVHESISTSIRLPAPTSSTNSFSSHTGIPSFPSRLPTPSPTSDIHPEPKGGKMWSPNIAALSLSIIILMALIVLAFIGYAIFLAFRKHKCTPACEAMKAELKKYKRGELKPITSAMVRAREKCKGVASRRIGSTAFPNESGVDLELGDTVPDEAARKAQHQAAKAALSAPDYVKPPLWNRIKAMFESKGKHSQSANPSAVDGPVSNTSDDRVFDHNTHHNTSYNSSHASQERVFIELEPSDLDYGHAGPSHKNSSRNDGQSATYSTYLTDTWRPREAEVQSLREDKIDQRASIVSSSLELSDPRYKARYEEAQRILGSGTATDEEAREAAHVINAVEGQKRDRIRYGGYGGLGTGDP